MPSSPITASVVKGEFGFRVTMNVPDGTVYATLERRANGVIKPVAGASNVPITDQLATSIDTYDYSALQNTLIEYRGVSLWTDGGTSEIVKGDWVFVSDDYLNFGSDVLFHAVRPDIRLNVTVEQLGTMTRDTPQEIVYGLDRADPIVVSGRTRYPQGQLTILTFDDAERRQLLTMLENTDILALSPWQPTYGFDRTPYYAIGKVTETRLGPRGANPFRRWVLDIQQVEPPLPEDLVGSSPTPVPPPNPGGPTNPDPTPGLPDPEGTKLWSEYQASYWRDIGTLDWGEVAGI